MKIKDEVHGVILLCPTAEAIIKTGHFQRLLEIKQLGHCREATHTRYHHCIGTYYWARKFMDHLERNTPGLEIPEIYKCCVALAGLLHDIGHGAFSHFWEQFSKVEHEKNGEKCIDDIFDKIPQFLLPQGFMKEHVELIKALITGEFVPIDRYEFLFEIINNKQCDIDVDKWDYLKRDNFHMSKYLPESVKLDLDFDKVFEDAKVSKDRKHIEYKYEHFDKIYKIFKARELLHIHIYQNRRTKVFSKIFLDALARAEAAGHEFHGKNLKDITSADGDQFLKLTDKNVTEFLTQIDNVAIRELMEIYKFGLFEETNPIENNNDADSRHYWCIDIKVEHAGEKMPKEERINFYGDKKDKPEVKKTLGFYEKKYYYKKK